jgi:phosphoribosylanthranilate isomerase
MIVQIYTVQSLEEGLSLADAGVDHIGVTPSACGLPGEVSQTLARQIFAAIGRRAVKVALSVETDLAHIAGMVSTVRPDILHLCGDLQVMTPARVAELRTLLPGVRIMQAIPVVDESALEIAQAYQPVADFLILDSYSPAIGGIGAAGFTHDWKVSREIVRQSRLPVILAGGLSPENVAEAIRFVRPWGVDSLTRTNFSLGDGKFRKDLDRVKQFVQNAREVDLELT